MGDEIISRSVARRKLLPLYYTGKPCRRGHRANRRVSNGQCVTCHHEYGARWMRLNREKARYYCRRFRARNPEYFKKKDSEKLINESPQARERRLARAKAYYAANQESRRAKNRLYREREKEIDPDAEARRSRKYKLSHPDKRKQIARDWGRRNKPKRAEATRRRNAARDMRTPPWLTDLQKSEMLQFYKRAADLKASGLGSHHVDHIVPLRGANVSGLHVPWNLQVISDHENMRKNNRYRP